MKKQLTIFLAVHPYLQSGCKLRTRRLKHTTLLLILFFLLPFTGCQKYEEGPLISFMSAVSRIEGLWKIEKYTINEKDSTDIMKLNYGKLILYDGSSRSLFFGEVGGAGGTWLLLNSNKEIELNIRNFNDSISVGPFGEGIQSIWTIKKLTNSDFILETIFKNNSCRIELKKQNT